MIPAHGPQTVCFSKPWGGEYPWGMEIWWGARGATHGLQSMGCNLGCNLWSATQRAENAEISWDAGGCNPWGATYEVQPIGCNLWGVNCATHGAGTWTVGVTNGLGATYGVQPMG